MRVSRKRSASLRRSPASSSGDALPIFLKDRMNVLNIFVCADKEDRIRRLWERITSPMMKQKKRWRKTDEERASYYYEHTGKTWGDVNDYHMIMDTSELGVETARIY